MEKVDEIPEKDWERMAARLKCHPISDHSEKGVVRCEFTLFTMEPSSSVHRSEAHQESHGLFTVWYDLHRTDVIVPFFLKNPSVRWAIVQTVTAFGISKENVILWGAGQYPEVP